MGSGTNIGKVRGLGSAKHGGTHWISQRTTAVGNLLLTTWLVASLLLMPNFDQATLALWLAKPSVAVPMILMLVSVFWHARLGLQVLIEDYVHDKPLKTVMLLANTLLTLAFADTGIFAVAKIAFA